MQAIQAVLIPGDGIGREISQSVKQVSQVLGTGIVWQEYAAGAEYAAANGELLQPGTLDAIAACHWALKGPTATPIGKGFRSINVQLRQRFATYANLRPVRTLAGVPCRFSGVDIVIVRENTEDLYKGIEYMLNENTANGIKLITREASEKICRFAFDYARKNGRKKVTAVHKANIMKLTDGLFLDSFHKVAADYPEIAADDVIIDALCMKLVQKPEQFDMLVAPNLYGDIISDLCAGLVGGLGFAPSANIGEDTRIYEAVHGSAPDIAGQDKANPSAILMAFGMMLRDLGQVENAEKLQTAILDTVAEGKTTTADIGGTATTTAFTEAVIARLQ
ncbi:MAG: isocitrate/isopropylmalate dehydrogenase family protein [Gemmiger sp.]|nr:isocitrate/isopropylmalate dehydrogenase family protein [Gemmiger sp.]